MLSLLKEDLQKKKDLPLVSLLLMILVSNPVISP